MGMRLGIRLPEEKQRSKVTSLPQENRPGQHQLVISEGTLGYPQEIYGPLRDIYRNNADLIEPHVPG